MRCYGDAETRLHHSLDLPATNGVVITIGKGKSLRYVASIVSDLGGGGFQFLPEALRETRGRAVVVPACAET